jgi:hypothetical protein
MRDTEVDFVLDRVVHHAGQALGQGQLGPVRLEHQPGPDLRVVARPAVDHAHVAEHRAGRDAAEDTPRHLELTLRDEVREIMGYPPLTVIPW